MLHPRLQACVFTKELNESQSVQDLLVCSGEKVLNVVKWHGPFLVFANRVMSILMNELEKLCFFFL